MFKQITVSKSINLVKETAMIKSLKIVFVVAILSFIVNAFLIGRHVAMDSQISSNHKVIEAVMVENIKLKSERDAAVVSYMQTKAKLDSALIPEATLKSAMVNHVVEPTKEAAVSTFNYTKDGATIVYENSKQGVKTATDFVKDSAMKAWTYVQG